MSREHYQFGFGHRERSNWGDGDDLSEYAEGDIVMIPEGAVAFREGRIPHSWSPSPERCKPGKYRIISVFSIDEGPSYYYRVAPIVDGRTLWDEVSDRLHVVPGECDFTADWTLVRSAAPSGETAE